LHRSSIGTSRRLSGSRAPGRNYWRAWGLVVTWGVALKALDAVLPMSLTTLKALTWDLVCFAVPTSQVELVWKAVQARHRQFHLPPPMCEANQFLSWSKMLGSIRGRPAALKLPIQKATVHWLLAWRPETLAAHRARLLTVVATLACLRVNEVAQLQVCDLWFDYLTSYGVPCFEGTDRQSQAWVARLRPGGPAEAGQRRTTTSTQGGREGKNEKRRTRSDHLG
jgi:hypothetical protein